MIYLFIMTGTMVPDEKMLKMWKIKCIKEEPHLCSYHLVKCYSVLLCQVKTMKKLIGKW